MKATSFIAAALLAAGTTAGAQEPPTPQRVTYLRPATFPLLATVEQDSPAAQLPAPQPASEPQTSVSRTDIRAMESLLTNALQKGAQDLAQRMQVNEPGSRFVTGTGRARGFALDGYGIFFDVDVPGMKQSLVWSAELLRQIQQAENLRQFIANNPDSGARRLAVMELGRLERQMNAVRSQQVPTSPQQIAPLGQLVAQAVNESTTLTAPVAPGSAIPAPVADLRDPSELYTDAVKNALIDAMLKYSGFLKIGAEEWLTVAARDSEGPPVPGQIDDASTIIISIKGSDLAAFQSNKLTRDEVLKKVVVKEF